MTILSALKFHYFRVRTEFRYSVWVNLKQSYPSNSDKYKAIFIHIPKTAGTSLYDLIGYTGIGHVPYNWYKVRDISKFNKYFKFSFIRNPWDRLVSTYFYLQKGGNNAMDHHWAKKNIAKYSSFNEFVIEWLTEENVNSWIHFIPQYKYIFDKNDNLQVDYLARFENLEHDFKVIAQHLNLLEELPHMNASKRSEYQNYYNDITKSIVARVYEKDIKLLGYKFENQ